MSNPYETLRLDFDQAFDGLNHFSPAELRFLGHSNEVGKFKGRNHLPPRELWSNGKSVARVADRLRQKFGSPLIILSGYRSPAYNRAIGGARSSQHLQFAALDLAPSNGRVRELFDAAHEMRAAGTFRGGIGRYPSFVHIDIRGVNADW